MNRERKTGQPKTEKSERDQLVVSEIKDSGRILIEKRLTSRECEIPEAYADLVAEAKVLELLAGRGAPRLEAVGASRAEPWLRMEKVPFPTLAVRMDGLLVDEAWALRAFRAALGALADVHEAADARGPLGVVHADLSPGNLAIDDAAERAVLLDFGFARWREARPRRDGAFRGTVLYVAPEVARGEEPTAKSDLFSLAASFAHAVAGAPLRRGASLPALIALAAEDPVPLPDNRALAACLSFDPASRPESARALLARLTPP